MIEITVTIHTHDHNGDTTMTKTLDGHSDNPLYYARYVREQGPKLVEEMAGRMATLHGDIDKQTRRGGTFGAA